MDKSYDIVVIGGGIHGAVITCKAALAGLRVALVEKNDFCGGCSANSLKIIHGGLRYLQHLDFKRMRESISSRREYMLFSPHLVKPLSSVMPSYGHGIKGREVMRLALFIYDLISFDRNKGLQESRKLQAGRSWTLPETIEKIPGISIDKLHGAVIWQDGFVENSERLVLEYIMEAVRHGADCFNYCKVEAVESAAGKVTGVRCFDGRTKQRMFLKANTVVNVAGSWYDSFAPHPVREKSGQRWARALNIVVKKKLFPDYAVAMEGMESYNDKDSIVSSGGRMLFFVPWRDQYTMIGTHYIEKQREENVFPVDRQAIKAMVKEINEIYPTADICYDDVSFYHAGLLPMTDDAPDGKTGAVQLAKSFSIHCYGSSEGFEGLYSIRGVKYTTAPHVADEVLGAIKGDFKSKVTNSHDVSGVTGSAVDNYLVEKYGYYYQRVKKYLTTDDPCLSDEPRLLAGEVRYFIHEEMALTLGDVVFRRSDLGTAECPPFSALVSVAELMAEELNWSQEQIRMEIDMVLERYKPLSF